jgi:hypothetical protein
MQRWSDFVTALENAENVRELALDVEYWQSQI